jgi:transcriptional regulator with XRE-family HTH domain
MFEEILKELRNNRGLTQIEVAKGLRVTQPTYQQWETGKRSPTSETLSKLADYFGVTTDSLLGRTGYDFLKLKDFLNVFTPRNENLDVKIYCFDPDIEISPLTFKDGKLLFSSFDLCLKDNYWFGFKNLKDDIIFKTEEWHNREVDLVDTYPRNRVNGDWWLIAIR